MTISTLSGGQIVLSALLLLFIITVFMPEKINHYFFLASLYLAVCTFTAAAAILWTTMGDI